MTNAREIWITKDGVEHETKEDAKAHAATRIIEGPIVKVISFYDFDHGLKFAAELC